MKINDIKTAKSRIVIIASTFFVMIMGSLYSIGLPAGASAGLMLGLKEPLSSMVLIGVLAICGLYTSTSRSFDIAILASSLMLAFAFSASINLVGENPALFRTIIFMCAATLVYIVNEIPVRRIQVYLFAAVGYFLGMSKGIVLPEITCPLYYLIGLGISVGLVLSAFILLGMALGGDVMLLIQKNLSALFKDKIFGSIKKLF